MCARNQRLLQNRSLSPQETFNKDIFLAREWQKAQRPTAGRPSRLAIPPLLPEETISIRCNTDAARRSDSSTSGINWIFTSPSASEINRGAMIQLHVSSPLLAESLAVREDLLQAISLNITHIWVHSDSQVLIRAIYWKRGPSELHGALSNIVGLSSSFAFCFISFVPGISNGPVGALAKTCLNNFALIGF